MNCLMPRIINSDSKLEKVVQVINYMHIIIYSCLNVYNYVHVFFVRACYTTCKQSVMIGSITFTH